MKISLVIVTVLVLVHLSVAQGIDVARCDLGDKSLHLGPVCIPLISGWKESEKTLSVKNVTNSITVNFSTKRKGMNLSVGFILFLIDEVGRKNRLGHLIESSQWEEKDVKKAFPGAIFRRRCILFRQCPSVESSWVSVVDGFRREQTIRTFLSGKVVWIYCSMAGRKNDSGSWGVVKKCRDDIIKNMKICLKSQGQMVR